MRKCIITSFLASLYLNSSKFQVSSSLINVLKLKISDLKIYELNYTKIFLLYSVNLPQSIIRKKNFHTANTRFFLLVKILLKWSLIRHKIPNDVTYYLEM